MTERGDADRRVAFRTLSMTAVAVILIGSSWAWFHAGDKIVGVLQLSLGGLLAVVAIVYGRLHPR